MSFNFGHYSTIISPSSASTLPPSAGSLRVTRDESLSIEWKMDDFPGQHSGVITSPLFHFLGSSWHLGLDPNHCGEWIMPYLSSTLCDPAQIVAFELGAKINDGTTCLQQTLIRKFREKAEYGIEYFLSRTELADTLTVPESLTIICKLRGLSSPAETNKAFALGLLDIFATKKHSDLSILVKDQEFLAHKVILAASSEVFSAMFYHEMSENKSGVLKVEDCEPETFGDFLLFLYGGQIDITDGNVYHLYTIGHKYCVEDLVVSCVAFMIDNISVVNVCDVATLGQKYLDQDILFLSSQFFEKNVREILVTSQWKSLMKDHYLVAHKLLEHIAPRVCVHKSTV